MIKVGKQFVEAVQVVSMLMQLHYLAVLHVMLIIISLLQDSHSVSYVMLELTLHPLVKLIVLFVL